MTSWMSIINDQNTPKIPLCNSTKERHDFYLLQVLSKGTHELDENMNNLSIISKVS